MNHECTCDDCPKHMGIVRDHRRQIRREKDLTYMLSSLGSENALLRAEVRTMKHEANFLYSPLQKKVNRQRLALTQKDEQIAELRKRLRDA